MLILKTEILDIEPSLKSELHEEVIDMASLVGKVSNRDLIWIAGSRIPASRTMRFACDCALTEVELLKPFTDNYDEIVEFLKAPVSISAKAVEAKNYIYGAASRVSAACYSECDADAYTALVHASDMAEAAVNTMDTNGFNLVAVYASEAAKQTDEVSALLTTLLNEFS